MNFPDEPIKPKNEQCGRWHENGVGFHVRCTLDKHHDGDHIHVTFTGAILKRWR